ncbi:MAG: mandelate racemase/muconate lactonizing enzyme family protein [Solirubrobacteraceae bacterium]
MDLRIQEVSLRLAQPMRAAWGEMTERRMLLVELEDDEGQIGHGEAAPLEPYDGVSIERCREALEQCRRALRETPGGSGAQALEACRAVTDLPHALAAIDLALWDRASRREQRSVASMLTDEPSRWVPVNAMVGADDPEAAAEMAREAADAGFETVKLKVGLPEDEERVSAVRDAIGPDVALRLDANGAWSTGEAIAAIGRLSPYGLELVEEPVHGITALRTVRDGLPVRVAMDETADEPGAIASGAADAVVLKVGRSGGIGGLLARATLARSTRADVLIASTWDGPLGVAAGVHAAAALRLRDACGLATLGMFEPASLDAVGFDGVSLGDLATRLIARDGTIRVPQEPGLV